MEGRELYNEENTADPFMRARGCLCVTRSDLAETGAENSALAPLCCIISDTKEIERMHEMVMRYPSLPTIISLVYCSGPK